MTRHDLSGLTHLSMSSRMTQARARICWHVHTHARPYAAGFWHENLKSALSSGQRDAQALDFARPCWCDGVKCMSAISMSVSLYLVNGAKRCGGGRCGAMRSGAANTERSDDDLEEERGKHQRDPKVFTNQQTWHYLDQF